MDDDWDAAAAQTLLLAYGAERGWTDTSPAYQPVEVVLQLATPRAGYGPLHLDALVQAAVVSAALGGLLPAQDARYTIPLPLQVLWRDAAGAPLYNAGDLMPEAPLAGAVSWTKRNDPALLPLAPRTRGGDLWAPDGGAGVFKAYQASIPTETATIWRAWAIGDPATLLALLATIPHIGKKGSWGFGLVSDVQVSARPEVLGDSCPGVLTWIEDQPVTARPVPLAALVALGWAPAVLAAGRLGWTPPYWLPANQAWSVPPGTPVTAIAPQPAPPPLSSASAPRSSAPAPVWSVAGFLVEAARRACDPLAAGKGLPAAELVDDRAAVCWLCGDRLPGAGIPRARLVDSTTGNVLDLARAPGAAWICVPCATVLRDPKRWHRNLAALHFPDGTGALLWPSVAPDPTASGRPLWRDLWLALPAVPAGTTAVLVCTDDPHPRRWPRAQVGTVGPALPVAWWDAGLGASGVVVVDVAAVAAWVAGIEPILDAGFTRLALATSLFRDPAQAQKAGWDQTWVWETYLAAGRDTPAWGLAVRAARLATDRRPWPRPW